MPAVLLTSGGRSLHYGTEPRLRPPFQAPLLEPSLADLVR